MRTTTFSLPLLGFLSLGAGAAFLPDVASRAQAASAEPQIRRVVVYPDRALVSRVAKVSCGVRIPVHFSSLPPAADASSLRAETSLGQIEGLRAEVQPRETAYAKAVAEIDEQLRILQRKQAVLQNAIARDDAESALAGRYEAVAQTMISRELGELPGPAGKPPAAWSSALETALQSRLKVAAARAERRKLQRELAAEAADLQQQRSLRQQAAARRELFADVLVTCPAGQQATVELSYMVGGAHWTPMHEARLDDSSARIQLTSFATLSQATGEDWTGAQLTLSTALPRSDATPPAVQPLRVYADPREPPKKVLVSRTQEYSHADAPADLSKNTGSPSGASGEGRRAAPLPQGLSVQFPIAESATVHGDGTPIRVTLASSSVQSRLAYRAVPKLLPHVFRVAELNNTAGYPLLAGPMDVLRRGAFIARYPLPLVPAGGRFELSFGLEERLRVKRVVIDEIARDRGVFGSTRRHNYAYRFELESYLDRPDEIEVSEHIPVSELADIQVGLDPSTSAGWKLNAPDGILTWRLPLRPGEKRALALRYYVDVPSSYTE